MHQSVLTRAGSAARVPTIGIVPAGWKAGPVVVWVHERGKQAAFEADGRTPSPEVKRLLAGGAAVLVPDVFLTGESGAIGSRIRVKNDETYFGYNTGYNRSVFAERASDVLTAIAFGKQLGGRDVALAGRGRAGAWALAARALAGDVVTRTAVDLGGFDFDQVRETTDEALLPGAVKYGGVRGPGVARDHRPHHDLRRAGGAGRAVAAAAGRPSRCRAAPASPDALVDAALKP